MFPKLVSVDEYFYDKKSDIDNLIDDNDGLFSKPNDHGTKSID